MLPRAVTQAPQGPHRRQGFSTPLTHSRRGAEELFSASKQRVTVFLSNLEGGGAERVTLNLLKGFSPERFELELVLISATGVFLDQVPDHIKLVDLKASGVTGAILPLARYLRQRQPAVLLSHLSHVNVGALVARRLAGTRTKVVIVEHNDLSSVPRKPKTSRFVPPQRRLLPNIMRRLYRQADAVVGVSDGVSSFIKRRFNVPEALMQTIYNPVVDAGLLERSREQPDHPWLVAQTVPTLIAVGRLNEQKDFATLLRAFATLRERRDVRLIIFGEGPERRNLEALAQELGVAQEVSLPGFAENPYAAMRRASLLVLSSRWEGLPTVLIEAMACGCPVVATDCPSGPTEILEGGRYGPLTEVGNVQGLADAILGALAAPVSSEQLTARAAHFSFENAVASYTALLASKAPQTSRDAAEIPTLPTAPATTKTGKRPGAPGRRVLQPRQAEGKQRGKWG